MMPIAVDTEFAWLLEAKKLIGVHECPGPKDNPVVLQMFKDAGSPDIIHDEVPWCAAFVGACLHRAGARPTGSLWALSYSTWGKGLVYPRLGAIATKKRFKDGKLIGGHVFFIVGWRGDIVYGLGGNQKDSVSVATFNKKDIIAMRWPTRSPVPATAVALMPKSELLMGMSKSAVSEN